MAGIAARKGKHGEHRQLDWAELNNVKYSNDFQLEIYNELARIFSEDNNAWAQREVLMREGTAKFADTTGENDRHLQKVFQKQVSLRARPISLSTETKELI